MRFVELTVAWSSTRGSPIASDMAFTTFRAIRLKRVNSLSLKRGFSWYHGCERSSWWFSQIWYSCFTSPLESTCRSSQRSCWLQWASPWRCGQCRGTPARLLAGGSSASLEELGCHSLEHVRGELPALVVGVSAHGDDSGPSHFRQSFHPTFVRSETHGLHWQVPLSSSLGTHAIMRLPRLRANRRCMSAVVSQTPFPVPGRK
mmetsp:Transcript_30348/g.77160  ORF Transcript_30348/g.77160 Transcript_30348/m.77160 type:complete len:203 (-) Transcript_30348:922-1530(-)